MQNMRMQALWSLKPGREFQATGTGMCLDYSRKRKKAREGQGEKGVRTQRTHTARITVNVRSQALILGSHQEVLNREVQQADLLEMLC